MIAVIAIMTILVTLCLAMILAASVLVSNAQKSGLVEQCRVSAVTFSKELDKDLTIATTASRPVSTYLGTALADGSGAWPFYNAAADGHHLDSPGVKKSFATADAPGGETGNISITMYWGSENGGSLKGATLYVEVTAQRGDAQYTVTSTYNYLSSTGGMTLWSLDERR